MLIIKVVAKKKGDGWDETACNARMKGEKKTRKSKQQTKHRKRNLFLSLHTLIGIRGKLKTWINQKALKRKPNKFPYQRRVEQRAMFSFSMFDIKSCWMLIQDPYQYLHNIFPCFEDFIWGCMVQLTSKHISKPRLSCWFIDSDLYLSRKFSEHFMLQHVTGPGKRISMSFHCIVDDSQRIHQWTELCKKEEQFSDKVAENFVPLLTKPTVL